MISRFLCTKIILVYFCIPTNFLKCLHILLSISVVWPGPSFGSSRAVALPTIHTHRLLLTLGKKEAHGVETETNILTRITLGNKSQMTQNAWSQRCYLCSSCEGGTALNPCPVSSRGKFTGRALWCIQQVKLCPWHWHPIGVPELSPSCSMTDPAPCYCAWEVAEDGPSVRAPAPT